MYGLKYTLGGPDYWEEPCYHEHIIVKNKLCTAESEGAKCELELRGYEYLGEFSNFEELQKYANEKSLFEEPVVIPPVVKPLTPEPFFGPINLKDIIHHQPKTAEPEWWKKK
jgi:hypothetical protein